MTSSSDLHWYASSAKPAPSTIVRSISTSPKSESAIMMVPRLVRVTGHPLRGDDVLVGGGEVEAAAGVHLAGVGAEQFLPGGLVHQCRPGVVAPSFGDLFVGELDVEAVVGDVERDAVAGFEDRDVAADRRFGADVQDGRCVGGAALPAVAECGDGVDAAPDQRGRRLHVHDLSRPGVGDVAAVAYNQDAVLV